MAMLRKEQEGRDQVGKNIRKKAVSNLLDMYPLFRKTMVVPMETGKENITKTQMRALMTLVEWENINMSKLAEEIAISPQQLSKIVTELENRGYVVRINDREYRRIVWVSLTDVGRELVEQRRSQAVDGVEKLFEKLSDSDIEELIVATDVIHRVIGKLK